MKRAIQFQPPRQSVIFGYTRRMLDETAINANQFAMTVAENYLQTVAPDVRNSTLQLGDGDALFAALKNNGQIIRRFMDGTVKSFPAELEDAWVMALPETYRGDCERALARRRGRYSIALPDNLAEADVAGISAVLLSTGTLCAGYGEALADGHVSVAEERRLSDDIDRAMSALLALRQHMAAKRQQQGNP